MEMMSLPTDMIENILSFLSYDEISKNRIVSTSFNEICMRMLNRGFLRMEKRHAQALKNVKAQLPRRESERRSHQLSRHCDILTSIETRISMLNMTYSKFIENGLCCFIPGKVIDEILRVLTIVETEKTPPRAHEVLQELRDISSMAIEHFDDKISPAFRRKLQEVAQPPPRPQNPALAPLVQRRELKRLQRNAKLNSKATKFFVSQLKRFRKQMLDSKSMSMRQLTVINMMAKSHKDQKTTIADLRKRVEECDIKYNEIIQTNRAVGGKEGASKATDVTSAQPCHFSSQIKLDLSVLPIGTSRRNAKNARANIQPRKPVIKLPSPSEADEEPPTESPTLNNTPSTSHTNLNTQKPKSQTMIAKIKRIANEIRLLSDLTENCTGGIKLKRSLMNNGMCECKKLKKY